MFEFMFIQMRPIWSFVSNCNLTGLWIPNVSQCNGQKKLNQEFLKVFRDAISVICLSNLFHSFITLGKR